MASSIYTYYFINRPPFVGTHPASDLVSQVAYPFRMEVAGIPDRLFHGSASYSKRLSFDQIWKYELYPDDKAEYELYCQWREENNK